MGDDLKGPESQRIRLRGPRGKALPRALYRRRTEVHLPLLGLCVSGTAAEQTCQVWGRVGEPRGGRGGDRSQPYTWGQAASEPAKPTQGPEQRVPRALPLQFPNLFDLPLPFPGGKKNPSAASLAPEAASVHSPLTQLQCWHRPHLGTRSVFLLWLRPLWLPSEGGTELVLGIPWREAPGSTLLGSRHPPHSLLSPDQCSECGSLFHSQFEPSPDREDPESLPFSAGSISYT